MEVDLTHQLVRLILRSLDLGLGYFVFPPGKNRVVLVRSSSILIPSDTGEIQVQDSPMVLP
jgi:hypothetical protein